MKISVRSVGEGTSRLGLGVIAGLWLLALLFLFLSALLGTADMNMNSPGLENIDFLKDSVALNLLWLLGMVAFGTGLMLLARRLGWGKWLTTGRLSVAVLLWVVVWGSLWVIMSLSAPTHDSLIVTRAGVAAANGNMEYLQGDYFHRFPFQLGYVFWTELWARLFRLETGSYLVLEFVNVACLAAGEMALVRLTGRLFGRWEVTFASALAMGFFVQPIIFCTFLYGTMPGFCFAAWAMLFFVRYLQNDRWYDLAATGLLLAVSVSLKLNNLILLVAMVILLLFRLLRGRWWQSLLSVAVLCTLVLTLKNVGLWQYQLRTDHDFGDGIPMTSWLAMGLNDAATAPGWYSHEYTVGNFNAVDGDTEAAAALSQAEIKERVDYFVAHPGEAAAFFSTKIRSQWNEPTYQSIWNNQVRGQYGERNGLAAYACGEGEPQVKTLMDAGVQFIFFGGLLAAVALLGSQLGRRRDRAVHECALWLIPLAMLGGFLYHALFEAKSQYVITYMIFMIPYAIWGVFRAAQALRRWVPALLSRIRRTKRTPATE